MSNAQVRSAMPASATSCARSRRRKARPSRPTSSAAPWSGNDATARSSGPVVPSATRGDAAVPVDQRLEHRRVGRGVARRREHRGPSQEQRAPVGGELALGLVDQRGVQRVDARRRAQGVGRLRARRGAGRGSGRWCAPLRRWRRRPLRSRARGGRSRPTCAAAPRTRRPRRCRRARARRCRRCRRRPHRCGTRRDRARRGGRGATPARGRGWPARRRRSPARCYGGR